MNKKRIAQERIARGISFHFPVLSLGILYTLIRYTLYSICNTYLTRLRALSGSSSQYLQHLLQRHLCWCQSNYRNENWTFAQTTSPKIHGTERSAARASDNCPRLPQLKFRVKTFNSNRHIKWMARDHSLDRIFFR